MKTLITLVFIGAIIALGVIVGRGDPSRKITLPASSDGTVSLTSPAAQGGGGPTGKIIFLTSNKGTNEIYSIDVNTKSKKLIFTDAGASAKIRQVSNLTHGTDSVLVFTSVTDSQPGELIAVAIAGGGKTTLVKDFLSNNSPSLSSDKSHFAFTSFSNAESNFGFTLLEAKLDGSDKRELAKDGSGISNLDYGPDGKDLALLKGAGSTNDISVLDLSTKKVATLYSFKDKVIEDFDRGQFGLVTATASGQIYLIDPKNKTAILLSKSGKGGFSPHLSPDASTIVYIENSGSKTNAKTGEMILVGLDGNKITSLGQASQIIGWAND